MNMAEALQEASERFDLYDDIIMKIKFGKLTRSQQYDQLNRMWTLRPPANPNPTYCRQCLRPVGTPHEAGCFFDPKGA